MTRRADSRSGAAGPPSGFKFWRRIIVRSKSRTISRLFGERAIPKSRKRCSENIQNTNGDKALALKTRVISGRDFYRPALNSKVPQDWGVSSASEARSETRPADLLCQ